MTKEITLDIITGEIVFRDYTKKELDEMALAQKETDLRLAQLKIIESHRASALAKLAALGLTEDEIAAL